jgi:hypothetical protein
MKYNLLKLGLLTALIVMTVTCTKEQQTISDLIIGKWQWIKTIIPYGGQESNPETSGFSKTLEFKPNGKMQEYRNDSLINTSNYTLEINPSNPKDYKLTNSTILNSHFYFEHDTLIFSEAYVDGPVYYYVIIQ